jgi:hypothetical protein
MSIFKNRDLDGGLVIIIITDIHGIFSLCTEKVMVGEIKLKRISDDYLT